MEEVTRAFCAQSQETIAVRSLLDEANSMKDASAAKTVALEQQLNEVRATYAFKFNIIFKLSFIYQGESAYRGS